MKKLCGSSSFDLRMSTLLQKAHFVSFILTSEAIRFQNAHPFCAPIALFFQLNNKVTEKQFHPLDKRTTTRAIPLPALNYTINGDYNALEVNDY